MNSVYNICSTLSVPFRSLSAYLPAHLAKVSKVAIPLLALISAGTALYYFRFRASKAIPNEVIPPPEVLNVPVPHKDPQRPVAPLSPIAQEAVEFANAELSKNRGIWIPETHFIGARSGNGNVEKMATLYQQKYEALKKLILSKEASTVWQDQEVLNLANELMNLAFAISNKTLEELCQYLTFNKKENIKDLRNKLQPALQCARAYRYLRYIPHIDPQNQKIASHPGHQVPEVLARPFYTEGTLQNKWRALHNEFYTRLEMYVDSVELQKRHEEFGLFNQWVAQDIALESYDAKPKYLPWQDPLDGLL